MNKIKLNKLIQEEKERKRKIRKELRRLILKLKLDKRIDYKQQAKGISIHAYRITNFMKWDNMEISLLELYLKKLKEFSKTI